MIEQHDHILRRFVVSREPQYSRGDDDVQDPLPEGSFFSHVEWKHRTINSRTNEVRYHDYGFGDLYFYKTQVDDWHYEFRFQYDDGNINFRSGEVISNVNCNWFMMWFMEHLNGMET